MPEGMAVKAQYSRGAAFRLKLRFGVRIVLIFPHRKKNFSRLGRSHCISFACKVKYFYKYRFQLNSAKPAPGLSLRTF